MMLLFGRSYKTDPFMRWKAGTSVVNVGSDWNKPLRSMAFRICSRWQIGYIGICMLKYQQDHNYASYETPYISQVLLSPPTTLACLPSYYYRAASMPTIAAPNPTPAFIVAAAPVDCDCALADVEEPLALAAVAVPAELELDPELELELAPVLLAEDAPLVLLEEALEVAIPLLAPDTQEAV